MLLNSIALAPEVFGVTPPVPGQPYRRKAQGWIGNFETRHISEYSPFSKVIPFLTKAFLDQARFLTTLEVTHSGTPGDPFALHLVQRAGGWSYDPCRRIAESFGFSPMDDLFKVRDDQGTWTGLHYTEGVEVRVGKKARSIFRWYINDKTQHYPVPGRPHQFCNLGDAGLTIDKLDALWSTANAFGVEVISDSSLDPWEVQTRDHRTSEILTRMDLNVLKHSHSAFGVPDQTPEKKAESALLAVQSITLLHNMVNAGVAKRRVYSNDDPLPGSIYSLERDPADITLQGDDKLDRSIDKMPEAAIQESQTQLELLTQPLLHFTGMRSVLAKSTGLELNNHGRYAAIPDTPDLAREFLLQSADWDADTMSSIPDLKQMVLDDIKAASGESERETINVAPSQLIQDHQELQDALDAARQELGQLREQLAQMEELQQENVSLKEAIKQIERERQQAETELRNQNRRVKSIHSSEMNALKREMERKVSRINLLEDDLDKERGAVDQLTAARRELDQARLDLVQARKELNHESWMRGAYASLVRGYEVPDLSQRDQPRSVEGLLSQERQARLSAESLSIELMDEVTSLMDHLDSLESGSQVDEVEAEELSVIESSIEALEYAQREFPYLTIGPDAFEGALLLDQNNRRTPWARKVMSSLMLLNDYAAFIDQGGRGGNLKDFALSGESQSKLVPSRIVIEGPLNDAALDKHRYRASGSQKWDDEVWCGNHIRIDNSGMAPRLHFSDHEHGQGFLVGYLGKHLPTRSVRT